MGMTYAGLRARALAFALDYLVIAGYLVLLAVAGMAANLARPGAVAALVPVPVSGHAASFLLVTLPVGLYFALTEASPRRATWGKRKVGLSVVGRDGARLSVGRSLWRTTLKFVPWELAHTLIWQVRFAGPDISPLLSAGFVLAWLLVGANVASLLLSRAHQTLYDWLAGTYVLKR